MPNDDLTIGEVFDEGTLANPRQTHDGDDNIFLPVLLSVPNS